MNSHANGELSPEENALLHGNFSDITLKKREETQFYFGNLNNCKEKKHRSQSYKTAKKDAL